MASIDFVHLHVHSSFSLLEGALTIARLAELAKADHQPALALTDTDNMFGALEFSEKLAGSGIQPIIGCALAIDFGDSDHGPRNVNATPERSRIVLLAQRQEGYRSLMRLNSRAFLDTPANEPPRLKLEWLEGETADVIALTGGPGGPLDMAIAAGQSHFASGRLDALIKLFGNRLYVELQRHGTAAERRTEPVLIDLAYGKGVPLVATNEPYFATVQDYEAHDALICIAEGRLVAESDRRQLTSEHRFKSRTEMVERFRDLPEALKLRSAARSARGRTIRYFRGFRPAITANRSTKRVNCASVPKKGSSGDLNPPGSRPVIQPMNIASGLNSNSASSPA
jgi:DNA polymerase-3 subunit alpha